MGARLVGAVPSLHSPSLGPLQTTMVTVADMLAVSGAQHSLPSTQVAEVPGWHRHSLEQPLPPGRAVSPGPAEADAPLPTVPWGPSP